MDKTSPIGVFDSGLGGISVLAEIHKQLPHEDLLYIGDSIHNPYGTKSEEELLSLCLAICDELMLPGPGAVRLFQRHHTGLDR
ncbi:hypothetical protein [Dubosiella newyorkensis]|uniref:hypothetical protein n=1 Tax=Dubosiella newyorkensis TaxID=1862672 RepID=UPI00272B1268|nr:hypothetical protein [Dubosiella newyorkensis]